jgi:two-component system sensor histidine kinase DegS
MTPAAKSRRKSAPTRQELDCTALCEFLADGSEVTRGQAYNLGRTFLKDGLSLVELAVMHPILDDLGLVPAIHFLAGAVSKRSNLPIHVSAEIPERISRSSEIAVYRVVQEALTNAVKHSQARSASVEIFRKDATLHCIIQDDGVGFSPESVQQAGKRKGLGLVAMQERLNAIGGTIQFESAPMRGTTIRLSLPDL